MSTPFSTPIRKKTLSKMITIPSSPLMTNLGYGTGAAVYRMVRSPCLNAYRSPWAVKKITFLAKNNKCLNTRLKQEADILKKLVHPNIVGFRAYVTNEVGEKCLVMEDCEKSLGDLIEERGEASLEKYEPKLIMKVAADISSALDYLHNTALILHCDVKSFNVLVKGEFQICKLCDFGVSMPLLKDGSLNTSLAGEEAEYIGTSPWCPREVLAFPSFISDRADIYALGIVLWEMMALSPPPAPESGNDDVLNQLNDSDMDKSIVIPSNHSRPDLPEVDFTDDYNYVLELFHCMTDNDYSKRPNATDLVIIVAAMTTEMDKKFVK